MDEPPAIPLLGAHTLLAPSISESHAPSYTGVHTLMATIVGLCEKFREGHLSRTDIQDEIAARRKILPTLVGNLYPGILCDEIHVLEVMELASWMSVWDQTIGCNRCVRAWWGDYDTEDPTMFHRDDCPNLGRRDVAAHWFNLDYVEKCLGRRCGR